MQASLFDRPGSALDDLFTDLDHDDGLRWYQRESVDAIRRELLANRSTLIVMATGTGKTRCFSQLIREWDKGPVLVLAHREELIQQAKASLELIVGDYVDIERAQEQSSFRSRYVVGSIDSVRQKKRLERMGHERFSLVVVDEGHHIVSASYRKVLDWFGPAKILGVTATPDRADEKALGQIFDSVAYVYDIEAGIDDGFLVPLEADMLTWRQSICPTSTSPPATSRRESWTRSWRARSLVSSTKRCASIRTGRAWRSSPACAPPS